MDGPYPSPTSWHQSLAAVVAAIEAHRGQMARLLDSLDDLARPAVSDGPSGPTGGTDVSTVVSTIADRLRLDDARLGHLAAELDGWKPSRLRALSHDVVPGRRGMVRCEVGWQAVRVREITVRARGDLGHSDALAGRSETTR